MNFYDIFKHSAKRYPEKMVLTDGQVSYTYHQLHQELIEISDKWKNDLTQRVVLILETSPIRQLLLFLAISYQNGIPILLHEELSKQQIEEMAVYHQIDFLLESSNELQQLHQFNVKRGSIALGVLSSGTTNLPKLMYRSCESWSDFFSIQNEWFHIDRDTTLFMQGSLSFTGNLNALLSAMFVGASIVMTSMLNPRQWKSLIKQYDADVVYLIPTKLTLLSQVMSEPLIGVKSIFTGSQFIFQALATKLKERFPYASIKLYYGTSEVSFLSVMSLDEASQNPFRVGKPLAFVTIAFNDNELLVTTPYAIDGLTQPYLVGDTGYLDKDGFLVLTGRCDDVVSVAGKKIHLVQLESKICELDHLREIIVFSIVQELKGNEIVVAYVPEKEFNVKEAQRLYPYRWWKLSCLPRISSGKIDVKQLKSRYLKEKYHSKK